MFALKFPGIQKERKYLFCVTFDSYLMYNKILNVRNLSVCGVTIYSL